MYKKPVVPSIHAIYLVFYYRLSTCVKWPWSHLSIPYPLYSITGYLHVQSGRGLIYPYHIPCILLQVIYMYKVAMVSSIKTISLVLYYSLSTCTKWPWSHLSMPYPLYSTSITTYLHVLCASGLMYSYHTPWLLLQVFTCIKCMWSHLSVQYLLSSITGNLHVKSDRGGMVYRSIHTIPLPKVI